MSNLGVQLLALRVKDLREITRALDLKGRSSPKTKQSLVDFIVRAQQTRVVTKKRILTEIKKKKILSPRPKQKRKTSKRKTPKQKITSSELRSLVEQRSAVNLKKVASVFGLRVGRKNKDNLIVSLILSVDRDALQKEVRKYPVLKKYQKRRKPKFPRKRTPTKSPPKEETKFKARTFGRLRDYFESAARFKKEMVLECAPSGLSTHELDEDRVALMNINLDAESFDRYSCPKAFFIKLDAAEVSKRMKKVLKKDEVTMEVQGKSLVFSIKNPEMGRRGVFRYP
uniref:Proliferating cell nuclear antigen n=1 Tax=Pithovirus LCPAC304 TaxID=2506594 RepID=A0A481Z9P6_9VIRU|nr:MAG: proliferating cell nuclear antigen [Pithovirus LCPAC304]